MTGRNRFHHTYPDKMQLFFDSTVLIARFLLLVAIILAMIKYKLISKDEKWYLFYLILVFFIEYISLTVAIFKINGGSNRFLYPIYIAGEFFTITGIFIKKLKLSSYSFIITGLLSLFFLVAESILIQYQYNNDYSKAISNIIMVCLIGYSLIQDIKNVKSKGVFQDVDKMFFLYFTVSIFIFVLQQQLMSLPIDYFSALWMINNILTCVVYSFFIYTFLKLKK